VVDVLTLIAPELSTSPSEVGLWIATAPAPAALTLIVPSVEFASTEESPTMKLSVWLRLIIPLLVSVVFDSTLSVPGITFSTIGVSIVYAPAIVPPRQINSAFGAMPENVAVPSNVPAFSTRFSLVIVPLNVASASTRLTPPPRNCVPPSNV
jgi:hypothetical protein